MRHLLPRLPRRWLLWLFVLLLPVDVYALDITEASLDGVDLTPHLHVVRDAEGEMEAREVRTLALSQAPFSVQRGLLNLGYNDAVWWLGFELHNPTQGLRRLLVSVDFPHHDNLTLYQFDAENLVRRQQGGDDLPFANRAIPYRYFSFLVELPPGAQQQYLLRVQSHDSLQLPLRLWDLPRFTDHGFSEQYLLGLYYGVMLVMLFYNLIIYYRLKVGIYLLYSGYIGSLLLVQLCMDGLAFQYLWPDYPEASNRLTLFFIYLTGAASIGFSRLFLATRAHLPRFDRLLLLVYVLNLALAGAALLTGHPLLSPLAGASAAADALLLFVTGLFSLRVGAAWARYYLIAWGAFLIGTFLVAGKAMGLLPSMLLTHYGMHFGSALEVVLFSLGLAERINAMRREKEQAQLALMESKQEALELQQRLTHAYQRFVPQEFLELLEKRSILDVGLGDQVQREMTILFSDIRSFTSLSERMTPEENFRFINDYLAAVGPLVRRHGGYIDKFIGDAVMALFSRSAYESVNAAIAMFETLREERDKGRFGEVPLEIGVGINTGSMMLGTLGEHDRMEGTVISDAVNLAARLEGLTKFYGTPLLISEHTLAALAGDERLHTRFIDRVRVKGKARAVEIYEVCDAEPEAVCQRKMARADAYRRAWTLYRGGEYLAAEVAFRAIRDPNREDRAVEVFIERCRQAQLLGDGWEMDGELMVD